MSLWDDYRRLVQQQTIDRPLYEQVQQPSAPSWDAPAAQPAQDYLSQISNPFAEAANNEATEAAKAAEKAAEEKRVLDLEARREQNKKITLDQLKAMNPADKQAYWNSMNEEENGRTAEIANARREGTTRSIGELYDLYNGARDVSEFRSQLIADKQNQGAGLNPVQAVASGAQGALDKAADNLKFFRNEQGDAVNADLSNPGTILPGLANAVTSFFPSMASAVPKAVNDIAASATGASIDNEAASENFNKNGYINLQDLTARGSSATERGANAASSALDILGMIPQAKAGVVAARGAQVVGGVARKAIGAGLKAGMAEGLTEGAQSLLDAHGSGVDITGGQVGGAALTGFLLGGGVGGGLTAVGGIRGNRSAARASANSGAANSGVDISGTAAETDTTGADFQATGAPEITTGTPATQIASNMAQPLEAGFGMNPTTPQNIAEAYEANRAPAPVEEVVNDFMTRNPEATPAQIAEVQNIAAQVDPTYVPEAAQPQQTIAPEAIRAQMATPEVTTPAADISNRVAEITPRVAENLPNNAAPVAENLPNNAAPVAPQNRVMSTENANGTIEVEYMSPDNQIETQTFDNHEEARNFVENDMGQDYNQSFEAPEQTTAAPETDYIRNPQNRPAEPGAHRAASPVEPRATQGRSNGAQNTSRANTQEASENASVAATEPQSANNSGRSRSGSQSSQNSTDARPGVQQAASNRTAESYAEIDRTLREHYGALDDAQIRTDLRNTAAEDGATFTMEEFRVIEQIVQERNIRFSSILGNPMETLRARAESYTSQAGRTLRFARIRTQQAIMNGEATRTQFIEEMTRNVPSGLTITPEFQSVIDAAADTYVEAANAYTRTKDQLSALTRNFEQGGGIIDPKAMTELTDTVRFLYNEMKQSARVSDIAILEEINSSGLPKKTTRAMKTEFAYNQLRSRGIYMHDWVDSSLLSGITGRIYDQWNGWQVVAEAVSPGAQIINRVVSNVSNTGVGARGAGRGLGRGVRARMDQMGYDINFRRRLNSAASANGAVNVVNRIKEVTTAAVELGDVPIEAATRSAVSTYYQHKLGGKPNKAYLDAMAELDPDGIKTNVRNIIAQEQGLGSNVYGLKTALQNLMQAKLARFGGIPGTLLRGLVKLADRTFLGFLPVTFRIAKRGASRLLLGSPEIIKAIGLRNKLKQQPGNYKLRLEMASHLARGLNDAKSTIEMAALGMTAVAVLGLEVTGGYPEDPRERARWEAEGVSPFSIKIGDGYWEMPRALGAFAYPFMLGAVFQQDTQEGLSPEEAGHNALLSAIGMLWGASGGESSISALGTIADLTKALSAGMGTGNFNGMMEALTTFANDKGVAASRMALPLSSLHSFAANLFDGKKRETYDPNKVIEFGKKIANGTFMRFALPPELGSMSEEVNNTQFLVRAMAGMSSTPTKSDRDELFNEAQRLGKAGYEVYPPDTRYKLTDPNSGLDIKLNGEQVQALQTADVAATRSLMQIAAQGDYYNSLPDVDKAAYLRSIASDPSIRATTLQLAKEMGLIGSDYEIKGVNASLTVDEQRILLEFGNKSETLKATDLENPKLAALYYAADYKNKEANGALTTDDTDLGKNGALYKMKVSEFNLANKIQPDAINGYGGANNTNIEDVNRANPELAKRIVLYDALLAENGLSGKNDSRYDMKFSSQADVFANDDFDFAALLSSLQYDTRKKNGRLDAGEDNYQYANASNLLFRKNRDIFLAENNIDKDLYRLYNDVSATDWKAMAKTDPELYEALWQLDKAMTDAKVSLRSSDHFRQKYERAGSSGGYGGGRSGGGGGSAKSAYTIGQIPSVEELRAKIMPVSKKGKTTTSMSIQGKSKMADLGFSNLKSKSTKSAGKGIKTEVTGYKASNTVKYSGSKTRQPNMGETYMAFLKGKTLQSSFTAQRKY